ncbi:hypothetical protein [Sulfitobacter sp. 20_GPM-1509m]|uniref:hypothetical protein n=1 Tax=Sulfitobacter sp. 20_GPM-1509m TaxID=1380367 RepID=UPI0012DD775A|nr:hypothetical protein [Sulfitobacter sp. 20_GPM-1509m]
MKRFQIREGVNYGHGFTAATNSAEWSGHLISLVPTSLHLDVQNRLRSNLAHILSSLDIEAGLILPHAERGGRNSVLFEPFYNTLILHFCIGTYSICEGLGAAFVLDARADDGTTGPFIPKRDWKPTLVDRLDPAGTTTLVDDLETVISKRDLIHQDQLGVRANIDWHSIGYESAFLPAKRLIAAIIVCSGADAPSDTNLVP